MDVPETAAAAPKPKVEEKAVSATKPAIDTKTYCAMCDNWWDQATPGAAAEHEFAMCLRTPPKLVAPRKEFELRAGEPRTWRVYGTHWDCPYAHEEFESKHCKICKPKRAEAEKRQIFEMQKIQEQSMFGNQEDTWGSASFQDAVIPEGAGGWVPGIPREGEERATQDLNLMAGR
jgi:hypothetical protein